MDTTKFECTREKCKKPVWPAENYRPEAFSGNYKDHCFHHAFWQEILDSDQERRLYVLQDTKIWVYFNGGVDFRRGDSSKGFGGRWFRIEYTDATKGVAYTNNLWSQSSVPDDMFHEVFPRLNALLREATRDEITAERARLGQR